MKKGNVWALLPIIVFLIIFLGGGIIAKDMYAIPTLLCFLLALVVAMFQNKKLKMSEKLKIFSRGVGHNDIVTMVLIFLAAGAFTGVVKFIGGVDSTVNFGLTILPPQFAVVGLFIVACFISMSMGTSVGTITALAPIGFGIAEATGFYAPMCLAAVVSGAMFGDNLSMVSDTTIAAVNTQGCNMKDKFKQNFFIVLPAALISMLVFFLLTLGKTADIPNELPYNFWLILPYIFVLVTAIIGLNVFIVLSGGTVLAIIIGLCLKNPEITFISMIGKVGEGMAGMYDISLISIVVAGIVELIKANGGIDAIIYTIKKCVKGKRGAEAGIAVLVTLVDFFTANNTVAIVIAGPIAKDIATEFNIPAKRSAAILDIFASFAQGVIPYGAQLLAAGRVEVPVSPVKIMPFLVYPYVMMICALIYIIFFTGGKRDEKKLAVASGVDIDNVEDATDDANLNEIKVDDANAKNDDAEAKFNDAINRIKDIEAGSNINEENNEAEDSVESVEEVSSDITADTEKSEANDIVTDENNSVVSSRDELAPEDNKD